MINITFRKDTDVTIPWINEDGKEEDLTLCRIVKAYADAKGISFYQAQSESDAKQTVHLSALGLDEPLIFSYYKDNLKHILSVHGCHCEIPDVNKQWNINDLSRLWGTIDYLMKM